MNKLNEGHGELLGWHDPDEMREWIRKNKSPILKDKTMSVKEATTKFIKKAVKQMIIKRANFIVLDLLFIML